MKDRLGPFALAASMAIAIMLSPCAWAQQDIRRAGGDQNATRPKIEKIQGVISEITAEGEAFFNHQTNTAVRAEVAFLKVIGSPGPWRGEKKQERLGAAGTESRRESGNKRHDVYVVWLAPRTKVCEAIPTPGIPGEEKKEVTFDRLEVGDRVEIEFTPEAESGAHASVYQHQQTRQKHGRHRMHCGYATAITILPQWGHGDSASERGTHSNDGSN